MLFLKEKKITVHWYDQWLGTFFCGFTYMMEGNSEAELKWLVDQTRIYMLRTSACDGMVGYRNWFVSMSALLISEYSLRNGLTKENKAALEWAHQYAVEEIDNTGGWFHHAKHGYNNYASDISMIGCMFYSTFLEMKALGINVEPGLTLAEGYVRHMSDSRRSIGYASNNRGDGAGNGGKNGLVLMGMYATGNEGDPMARSLGQFLSENPQGPLSGHASSFHHFFGTAVGLHRMGPEHYRNFAGMWLHRMIECQNVDGGIARFPHDIGGDKTVSALAELKNNKKSDWVCTGILAGMILMTEPGVFPGMARKKRGAPSNKKAYELADKAFKSGSYGKAYEYFGQVLPPGKDIDLITDARKKKVEIKLLSSRKLAELMAKETALQNRKEAKEDSYELVDEWKNLMTAYKQYAKDYEGMPTAKQAVSRANSLGKALFGLRARASRSGKRPPARTVTKTPGSNTGSSAGSAARGGIPAGMPGAAVQSAWEKKLRDRVAVRLRAGTPVHFDLTSLRVLVTITKVNEKEITIRMTSGGQFDMNWGQFKAADKLSIAAGLTETRPTSEDQALAAFFYLLGGKKDKGAQHLSRAGKRAGEVRSAFGE